MIKLLENNIREYIWCRLRFLKQDPKKTSLKGKYWLSWILHFTLNLYMYIYIKCKISIYVELFIKDTSIRMKRQTSIMRKKIFKNI